MNPIQIGLCGWGDHDLYPPGTIPRDKLRFYAGYFPVVELDSSFYAIPSLERVERWVNETPPSFRFVVKAYRELTGHGQGNASPKRSWKELVNQTKESFEPMQYKGKLAMFLFQFPPWYNCKRSHVSYLRKIREAFADYFVAIEFRNQSWFSAKYHDKTLAFLEEEQFIHVVCDEPQAGEGSVPIVLAVTNPHQALVRFHGRNVSGWSDSGNPNWRDLRYAYRYSDEELEEWVPRVHWLKERAKQVTLLFNNNSQGDAADNAQQMIEKLGIEFQGLAPRQLKLL
jgi:uncharacterized protein YecE (DUF72 family)